MLQSRINKSAQIAMEFLLIAGVSMVMIMLFLVIILNISEANTRARTYDDIYDLGQSLQTELLLASELEDGYSRKLDIPTQINNYPFTITIHDSTIYTYMIIMYKGAETFYAIPPTQGAFHTGTVYLTKNGTLYLTWKKMDKFGQRIF